MTCPRMATNRQPVRDSRLSWVTSAMTTDGSPTSSPSISCANSSSVAPLLPSIRFHSEVPQGFLHHIRKRGRRGKSAGVSLDRAVDHDSNNETRVLAGRHADETGHGRSCVYPVDRDVAGAGLSANAVAQDLRTLPSTLV